MDIISTVVILGFMVQNMALATPYPNSNLGDPRLGFLERSRTQVQERVAEACFGHYVNNSNESSENYRKDYSRCSQQTIEQRKKVDEEALEERRAIVTASKSVCQMVQRCDKLNNSLELLNCHAEVGGEHITLSHRISNTSDYVALLRERYRDVDANEEKCYSVAVRVFVHRAALNYDRLQKCLNGRLQPKVGATSVGAITHDSTTEMEPLTTP